MCDDGGYADRFGDLWCARQRRSRDRELTDDRPQARASRQMATSPGPQMRSESTLSRVAGVIAWRSDVDRAVRCYLVLQQSVCRMNDYVGLLSQAVDRTADPCRPRRGVGHGETKLGTQVPSRGVARSAHADLGFREHSARVREQRLAGR